MDVSHVDTAARAPAANSGPWFRTWTSARTPSRRLICFPHAGGAASVFGSLSHLMPDDLELCAVMLPGRERRLGEPAFREFHRLSSDIAGALSPLTDLPYTLLGHSMGTLLAYEFARHATGTLGRPPAHLVVSARGAPHRTDPDEDVATYTNEDIVRWMRRIGGTPDEVFDHPELLDIVVATLRADLEVCASYRYEPEPALTCPVTAIGGTRDRSATRADLARWEATTTGPFDVRLFSGGHFFLFDETFDAAAVRTLLSAPRSRVMP